MGLLRRIVRYIALNFVFFGGFAFVFGLGLVYAFVKPEGVLVRGIFLLLGAGWILFLIRYFWEILERRYQEKRTEEFLERQNIKITNSSEKISSKS